jgi:hypothetical protein
VDGERDPEPTRTEAGATPASAGGVAGATPASAGDTGRPPASPQGPPEHYGPLILARYRKDDGRALILYAEDEDAAGRLDG